MSRHLLSALALSLTSLVAPLAQAADPANPSQQGVAVGSAGFNDMLAKQVQPGNMPISQQADGSFRLDNSMQDVAARVSTQGVRFESTSDTEGGGSFGLSLAQWGREGTLQPANSTRIYRNGDAVIHTHAGGIAEQFTNTSDGIRQDFIIPVKPHGNGELQVQLALDGATAKAKADGISVVLDESRRELTYDRLQVTDANQKKIPAHMELVASNSIRIVVDDSSAQYPLTIDPTVGDANWVSIVSSYAGTDGVVYAMVSSGSDLYVGGGFNRAGDIEARNIAKWDGSNWSALGWGLNSPVAALAIDANGNLYAAGWFNWAGNVAANHIAKWNGAEWSALGDGVGTPGSWVTPLNAVSVDNSGKVYVGGLFSAAGNVAAKNIAVWSGAAWSAMGEGLSGEVKTLVADANGGVVAGGSFSAAGSTSVANIARWDGSSWHALGEGLNNTVYALAKDTQGNIYAGGSFSASGSIATGRVAQWNGTQWRNIGAAALQNTVFALTVDASGKLYAGGYFFSAQVSRWDGGTSWSLLGAVNTYSDIRALAVDSLGTLYAGGWMRTSASQFVGQYYIAKWGAGDWQPINDGVNGSITSVIKDSAGNLLVSGYFSSIGGVKTGSMAKWDGSAWSQLGTGMQSYSITSTVADNGGNVYVSGYLTTANNVYPYLHVAKWNGSAWSYLDAGLNTASGQPAGLALDNSGKLYLAETGQSSWTSSYSGLNNTYYHYLSASKPAVRFWNGSQWQALADLPALPVISGKLYAGEYAGRIIAGGNGKVYVVRTATLVNSSYSWNCYKNWAYDCYPQYSGWESFSSIVQWDGSRWTSLGDTRSVSSAYSSINVLRIDAGNNLYIGGNFQKIGEVPAGSLAKWDGVAWTDFTRGLQVNSVRDLIVTGSGAGLNLYVSGYLWQAGSYAIARWNGAFWMGLGSGLSSPAESLALDGGKLYVGGGFNRAGDKASYGLAAWTLSTTDADGDGVDDTTDAFLNNAAEWLDTDGDGIGNNSDTDDDGDGVADVADNCSLMGNQDQLNTDNDAFGDMCDVDDDNDDVSDEKDLCPVDADLGNYDTDEDGAGDACEDDDDGDGEEDSVDPDPKDATVFSRTSWNGMNSGMDGEVNALVVGERGSIYVGGNFVGVTGSAAGNFIAKWNGASWGAIGNGLNGTVNAVAVDKDGNLYAGGAFTMAGDVAVNRVAKWDGENWTALGQGLDGTVNALVIDKNGNVYVAGEFNAAVGSPDNSHNFIAKWDGSGWSALGAGMNSVVSTLALDSNGILYAGGWFSTADGVAIGYGIAKWDGTVWAGVGSGTDGPVVALAINNNNAVYAGGYFDKAGGLEVNSVAKWDGVAWSAVGGGVSDPVTSLALDAAGNLYAGGYFTQAGKAMTNYVAKWDGIRWGILGSGTDDVVNVVTIDVNNGNLFAGGKFRKAGGKDASFIARWLLDTDGDGISDNVDNCKLAVNTFQLDKDADGTGNACDDDDDGDGVLDTVDKFPLDATESSDIDGDGIGNNADLDDDGDGVNDLLDAFPFDKNEIADTDKDGMGNVADTDDDGDGIPDAQDKFPLDAGENVDLDNDGIGDMADQDDDGDGVDDVDDAFPRNAAESLDTDKDGIGDKADLDDDGDGVNDDKDAFPKDAAESADADKDGVGDNADADDDNDNLLDVDDQFPLDGRLLHQVTGQLHGESAGNSGGVGDGRAIAYAGDFNGDGYGDFVVGTPFYSGVGMRQGGQVRIVSGKNGSELFVVRGIKNSLLGASVAGNADIDNDGYPDVLIGVPGEGKVLPVFGGPGERTAGRIGPYVNSSAAKGYRFGYAVALADVTGDGYADMIVGAPEEPYKSASKAGSVRMISGNDFNQQVVIKRGVTTSGPRLGSSLAVGDMDGDGLLEIFIGAPGESGRGCVYGYDYNSQRDRFRQCGSSNGSTFGSSIASGDINRDGKVEILVAAPGDRNLTGAFNAGTITLFSGTGAVIHKEYGVSSDGTEAARLGSSVVMADIDDDGAADILATAVGCDKQLGKGFLENTGRLYAWSGKDFALLRVPLDGESETEFLGTALAIGDINDDGKVDILIGSGGYDLPEKGNLGRDAGAVKVISGARW